MSNLTKSDLDALGAQVDPSLVERVADGDGCELCGHTVAADLTTEFTPAKDGVPPEPWVHCKDEDACTARVVVAKLHPGVDCRTCRASFMLVNHEESPEQADCLGLTRSPNFCNTWKMRVDAGFVGRRVPVR
jgi:hypothetical protein